MEEQTKRCTKCGDAKRLEQFHKDSNGALGVKSRCKSCINAFNAIWRKNTREERRLFDAQYRQNNREKRRASSKKWRGDNPAIARMVDTKYYWNNRDKILRRCADWGKNNPEKKRINSRNYHARKKCALGNGWTAEQEKQLIEEYNHRCAYCNTKQDKLEMDHIVPLNRGGAHIIDNIVPACKPCNSSKGDRPLLVWLYQKHTAYDGQVAE